MATILQRTREEIRADVGHSIGAAFFGSATSAGTTTTTTDTKLKGGSDDHAGKWMVVTSGNDDGEIVRTTAFDGSGQLTHDTLSNGLAQGDTYELWDEDMPPERIHSFINRAIVDSVPKAMVPLQSLDIHTSKNIFSYALPTNMAGVKSVYWRSKYTTTSLLTCDAVFDDSIATGVTASLDGEDYREGSGSVKLSIAASVSNGTDLGGDTFGAEDLSGETHIEYWIKSTVATSAGDLQILLQDNSTQETLNVPALTARTWTFVRTALANPENDTAITTLHVNYVTDIGAAEVNIDGVRTVEDNSEEWSRLHRNHWRIGQDQGELVLTREGLDYVGGYALLWLDGVTKPSTLTADSDNCEVDAEYVVSYASAQAFLARANRSSQQRPAAWLQYERMKQIAEQKRINMPGPHAVRWVSTV